MDKYEIEKYVMEKIQTPYNLLIADAIKIINSIGYSFREVENDIGLWRDKENELNLDITAILSVSCTPNTTNHEIDEREQKQKIIEDKFYEIAEEGSIREVNILSEFEGEIANGGFDQLYENKGLNFLEETIDILKGIGSKAKLKLAKEALETIENNIENLQKYSSYLKALHKIDKRYEKSKENIPIIYNRKTV